MAKEDEEETLKAQLLTYKDQMSSLSEFINDNTEVDPEMIVLQKDLQQLISLTEENLLEISKQRLLLSLTSTDLFVDKTADTNSKKIEKATTVEEEDSLQGQKCQAPLKESWGTLVYHNAVILNREEGGDDVDFNVRVLFTHPCFMYMKPCQYFMDGCCKFSNDTCRYSHGYIVSFSQLRAYQEPDYSNLCNGSRCLVKQPDELWHEAVVSSIGETIIVQFINQRNEAEVKIEDIFPIIGSPTSTSDEESDATSEEGSSLSGEEDTAEKVDVVRTLGNSPFTQTHDVLGEWEKYTTGFGSRLMAKMGYIIGQGLGKNGEGRVEPIKIEILPPGKSLDACAAIREEKKMAPSQKRKRNRGRSRRLKLAKANEEKPKVIDTFEFLNKKIGRGKEDSVDIPPTITTTSHSNDKKGNLNVQLFKVQEDIKGVNKRIVSLKEAIQRNQGRRDHITVTKIKEKLESTQKQLEELKRREKALTNTMKTKREQKKLMIF